MIKNSILYLFGNLMNKGAPFLLLPFLTFYLTPADYGLLSIFQVAVGLVFAVAGMSVHLNITKSFFVLTKADTSRLVSNCIIVLSGACTLLFVFMFVYFDHGDELFGLNVEWYLMMPALAFFNMCVVITQSIIRNLERAWLFVFFEIAMVMFNIGISIILIVNWDMNWEGRAIGIAIPVLVFSVISLIALLKTGWLRYDCEIKKIKEILTVSVPLVPHAIASMLITVSDRLFIGNMVTIEAVGIYTVGYSFGMVVALFTDAFIKAWSPWFYKHLPGCDSDMKLLIVRYSIFYILGLSAFVFIYATIAQWLLPYVVDDRYLDAGQYIMGVCSAYFLFGIYQIFFPYFVFANKTYYLSIATFIAASTNIALNFYLIPKFGAMGAVYSSIVAYFLSALSVVLFSLKVHPMPWYKGVLLMLQISQRRQTNG
jgi:O-antigen/teichoic acid export membrane protein